MGFTLSIISINHRPFGTSPQVSTDMNVQSTNPRSDLSFFLGLSNWTLVPKQKSKHEVSGCPHIMVAISNRLGERDVRQNVLIGEQNVSCKLKCWKWRIILRK